MSILNVENVSISFGGRTILENANFRLLNGEHVGLVGANGEGKSTFLGMITGKILPDTGKIEWCNRITRGYLDQYANLTKEKTIKDVLNDAFLPLFELEKEMITAYEKMADADEKTLEKLMRDVGEIQDILDHNGFYMIDAKVTQVAQGLGLLDLGLERTVDQLSGGQRTKVLLAKLLLENPKILILDEPTNFLDEEHIAWLKLFLKNYENAFILVSHDEAFMNDVINVVYHIEQATLNRYTGDYNNYLHMAELKRQQQLKAYEKQQKEIDDLEDFIARNKARVATRNMANSRQKKLDKMTLIEKPKEKVKAYFSFQEARTPAKLVIHAKDLVIGYDTPLTKPLNFMIERNEKVAIKGTNGLGKTTLLKTILGILKPYAGEVELGEFLEIGFFEQEDIGNNQSALQELWNTFPAATNQEIRAMLAKCGLTKDHIETSMLALSGGEKAKVRLAKLVNKNVNILVLDEPTNHLDVQAKEALKEALINYKQTLIIVSHDPAFYEDIVDRVMNIEDYTTKVV